MSAARADAVEARLAERDLDALLVSAPRNLRYVTGFTGSNGLAVVGRGIRRFLTDFRYTDQARAQVEGFDLDDADRDLWAALASGWPQSTLRLGFDDAHLPVKVHGRLSELLPSGIELVAAGGIVEAERRVKSPAELTAIAAAAALADTALTTVLEGGLAGRVEREVALALELEMRRLGAEALSFPSIVASGEHGARPHAEPRDAVIARDTLVTIDWGARLDGYHSDCTRTYATGDGVRPELLEIHALVQRAQAAGLAAVRPGPTGREVDAVARELVAEAGHGEHFGHGLGHGVGLDVHEGPTLSTKGEDALAAGNVVTVEPGVYLPGIGGVRIEDLVAVTAGGADVFSSLPKDLTTV